MKTLKDFIATFQWNTADIWEKENGTPKGGGAGWGNSRSQSPLAKLKRPTSAGPPPGQGDMTGRNTARPRSRGRSAQQVRMTY